MERKQKAFKINKPINIPTRETLAFIESYIPKGATILEVGCGEGHVALQLLKNGYQIHAINSDPAAIEKAKSLGVPASLAVWQEFTPDNVDAIVFTRSLHHIEQLNDALQKVSNTLKPSGILLVEDFAFEKADRFIISWFLEILNSKTTRSFINLNLCKLYPKY